MVSDFTNLVEDVITCPVCLKHYDEPRLLPCSHTFCYQCIQQLTSTNQGVLVCPNHDGTRIEGNDIAQLPPNTVVSDLIELLSNDLV